MQRLPACGAQALDGGRIDALGGLVPELACALFDGFAGPIVRRVHRQSSS
jgi:hypothetical protein